MKKRLSLLLAIAMVFSMFSSMAFAEEQQSAGEYLNSIGVVQGNLSGDLLEDENWNRQDITVILARLTGSVDEAAATPKGHTFADVTDPFYDSYITWAKEEGYFQGHSDVRFGYGDPITNKEFLAVMTRALGYNLAWDNIIEGAVELGLIPAEAVGLIDEDGFATRGQLYEAIIVTLNTETADGAVLGSKLGLPGFELAVASYEVVDANNVTFTLTNGTVVDVELEEALKANVENEVTFTVGEEELTAIVIWEVDVVVVNSVSATGLTQVFVEYNQDVSDNSAAADKDNYTVAGAKVTDVTVNGNVAVVSFDTDDATTEIEGFTNQTVKKVTVKKGVIEADHAVDVTFLDTTIPSVVGAEVIGNDTIKVIFSEPMENAAAGDFKVDSGNLYVRDFSFANNNTEINVRLWSTLEDGEVEIEVAGVEDFAGFSVLKKTLTVTVVEDNEAPVVVGYKNAKPTGVTLIFNEDIEILNDDESNFYHTNTNNPIDTDGVSVSGKELTLSFTDHELPAGIAYVYVKQNSVNDLWDNNNSQIQVEVQVTIDTEKPTVSKLEVIDEDQIKITFSEEVNVESDGSQFTLLDSKGDEKENFISGASGSGTKAITITFSDDLNGDYSIVIDGVADLAGNKIVKVTQAFTVDDLTKPDIYGFTAKVYNSGQSNQLVKVSFGERMAAEGRYSVADLEKYSINGDPLSDIEKVTIAIVDNGNAVEIKIPAAEYIVNDGDLMEMTRVADAAGNISETLYGEFTIEEADEVLITAVEVTSKNTVVVKFDDELTTFVGNDIELSAGGTELAKSRVSIATVSGKTVATITLASSSELNTNGKYGPGNADVVAETVASPTSATKYGQKLAASQTSDPAVDKAAPTVTSAVYDSATQITITLSEDLSAAYFASAGTNGWSVSGGGTLTSALPHATDANKIVLTGTNFTVNTNVAYTPGNLRDASPAGNKLAAYSKTSRLVP